MNVREMLRLAGFFGRLAVKEHVLPNLHVRPLVAELFLTENCNLRCVSCACWRDATIGELSTAEWQDVLRQLAALGIYKVNFTGGEPLTRRDAIELMQYARDVGIRHTHLNTNAILLTPARLEQVLETGVRSFNVSVDGPEALHDRIRGRVGAFAITIAHLRNLLAQRDRLHLKVRMNFTVMRENVASLGQVARLAQELRVQLYLNMATDRTFLFRADGVAGQATVPQSVLAAALEQLEVVARADGRYLPRYSDMHYMYGHFTDLVQRQLPCAESQLKLMIHSRGQIGGCWGHDPSASVRNAFVASVIDSHQYRQEHARPFRKDCVGCGSNYSLNLRWRPGTYIQDALWRIGVRHLVAP